jgi:hypothetical protein
VRDWSQAPPEEWELASSSSKQPKQWRANGFDFEEHLVTVLGQKMLCPLTQFHGSQVEAMFKHQDAVWQEEPLASGIKALEDDPAVKNLVQDLKSTFEALAVVHQQVNKAQPNMEELKVAIDGFSTSVKSFVHAGTLKPCRYKLMFYDHALMSHAVEMSEELAKNSLAVVSSRFLEANNKVVKAVMKRLPGGAVRRSGSHAHLPLVHGLKKRIALAHVSRPKLYESMKALYE